MLLEGVMITIALMFGLPVIIATAYRHKYLRQFIIVDVVITLATFVVVFRPELFHPELREYSHRFVLIALIAMLIWAAAGPRSKEQAPIPAVPNNPPKSIDQPRYDPNRHLPKNLEELDKLAVKIRKSLKESEKES